MLALYPTSRYLRYMTNRDPFEMASTALNDGPAFRLGQLVKVNGEHAMVDAIGALGYHVTVVMLRTQRKARVMVTDLQEWA